ncbi:MAG: YraN family protein [Pseudobdellovibrionaceae bacterium]
MVTRTSYQDGLRAEKIAAILMRLKGYKILATRFKTPVGEIDLVAKRGNTLVFTEVKLRKDKDAAAYAISEQGKQRISRAAAYYLSGRPDMQHMACRFDAILIVPPFFVRHLDNVWTVSSY